MDALEILEQLCMQPTVSYHEWRVAREIYTILTDHEINFRRDRWGNIIAEINGDEAKPPLVFVAHMDHPGFEAIETVQTSEDNGLIIAEPRGGLGTRAYDTGTGVHILSRDRSTTYGTIESHSLLRQTGNSRFARADQVIIKPETSASEPTYPAAVILDLPSFDIDGNLIRARQLDDLAGCAAILASITTIKNDESNNRPIKALFTRAEEVGLVGAALAASDELVSKDSIIVSVETSLKSENAKQGEGVIIRVGDRITTFDHSAEAVLHDAAYRIERHRSPDNFKVQRALMGAGGCEASAFKAHGYQVTGTSFPLGAWHNTEDDGSIVPEYIHLNDFNSGVALITEAMRDDDEHRRNDPLRYLSMFPETGAMRLRETL